jgi:pyruvate formate lyase activating enzyme
VSAKSLAEAMDDKTACICYFGGDPSPQLIHALAASREALDRAQGRILRICWETNGSMDPIYLEAMADLSLKSGGCIKFDLKAWHEEVNLALCGISNKRTLENFRSLAPKGIKRPQPPFLIASTLLVPGYIDVQEITGIARFIASIDPDIPYALLAFHPQFYLDDLPTTSRNHALECKAAAEEAGLHRVRIGNLHLLGNSY